MLPVTEAHSPAFVFARLAVHQDYAWFAALLGWSLALVAWWWHPQRRAAWSWLPWSAVTGGLSAAVQFAIFNPPLELFHDRLIPGTLFNYAVAPVSIEVLGDLLLGLLTAVCAAGWWLAAPMPQRLAAWLTLAVASALYPGYPWGARSCWPR